ncbi:hypothetical protein ACVWXN_010169 [Bradyrhizobium sp. i1.4.4]|uniref:hypothetical protein n=1 Tax=Bradyrhizobium sp. LA6.10 TaxID=3156318 RepID=UPI003392739B
MSVKTPQPALHSEGSVGNSVLRLSWETASVAGCVLNWVHIQRILNRDAVMTGTRNRISMFLIAAIVAIVGGRAAHGLDLSVAPATVTTGYIDSLVIESGSSFDLSKVKVSQITFRPDNDVTDFRIRSASATRLDLSVDLSDNAELGPRTIIVTTENGNAEGRFEITQEPAITVAWPGGKTTNSWVNVSVDVVARGGVDLSQVGVSDVMAYPHDKLTVLEVTNQTKDRLTVGLLSKPITDQNATYTLDVGRDTERRASFSFADSHDAKVCQKAHHCCKKAASGGCNLCLPIDQLCRP